MRPLVRAWVIVTSVALAMGCSSDGPKKAAPRPTGFAADPPKESSGAVFLRGRPRDTNDPANSGQHVRVDVVARGIDRAIHGAAFRLSWNPAQLAFDASQGSDAWSSQALLLAKEGAPGELVVAWTEKGGSPGVSPPNAKETVLGTINFTLKTGDGADLEFRPDRSTLRDPNGLPLTVEWRGGRVDAGR